MDIFNFKSTIINTEDTATTNATFSKVRVIRTNDNPAGSTHNWINFYELQVWVNGTNIAFNAPTKTSDLDYANSESRWHSHRAVNGIINENGNVLGMMPHPERACDKILGSDDGKFIFKSIIERFK